MNVEVDKTSSEEGGDVLQRGVEGELSLERACDRSIGCIEGPGDDRSILAHCTSMEVSLGELSDAFHIEEARCIALVEESDRD